MVSEEHLSSNRKLASNLLKPHVVPVMMMFSPAVAEFLQYYAHDQPFRWSAEDLAAQAQFVTQTTAGLSGSDWSDPALAMPLLQAAMLGTPTAIEHGYDAILLAGPLTEILPAETLLDLALGHLNPAGTIVAVLPCLRDNSPESQQFMDVAQAKLWPYRTAEEWLELFKEVGFDATQIKAEFVPIPQFVSSALTDKLRFTPFKEVFTAVEAAGYGAHEVGWGELRLVAKATE